MNTQKKLLLLSTFVTYPGFDTVFKNYQYQVTKVKTLRKALSFIKQIKPDVIVAEFIYAPTYGSQLSNFESLFAAAQAYAPDANFIALVHKDDLTHLEQVSANIKNCQILTLPAQTSALTTCLDTLSTVE